MGINLPRQEESDGLAREKCAELPEDSGKSPQPHALPQGSEAAQGATAKWEGVGVREVKSTFKPGLPSEAADNKEAAKVSDAREGGGWMCQVDSSAQSFILERT